MTQETHRAVHHFEYPQAADLSGKDLISVLERPRVEVAVVVGDLASKANMQLAELPAAAVTAMDATLADEVHAFPNATLGPRIKHLVLHFREDRLVGFRWSCPELTRQSKRKPWYRRLFGG